MVKWYIDPIHQGPDLAAHMKADGLLVDTFDKGMGKGLMDYYSLKDVRRLVAKCHGVGVEAWLAGSIGVDDLPALWEMGVDVICVRAAACEPGTGIGRFGGISSALVVQLVETIGSYRS